MVFFVRYFRDITRGTMVILWADHAALIWVPAYHQSDNLDVRWIVELNWIKPWRILHIAVKSCIDAEARILMIWTSLLKLSRVAYSQ